KAFINHPSNVLVLKLTSDRPGSINLRVRLNSKLKYNVQADSSGLQLTGTTPHYVAARNYFPDQIRYDADSSMRFAIHLGIRQTDGGIIIQDSVYSIKGATEVILFLYEATNYCGFDKLPGSDGTDADLIAAATLKEAMSQGYENLLREHVGDYQRLFHRV